MNTNSSVIRMDGVSKAFQRYANPFDWAFELVTGRSRHEKLWALRDISFSIPKGEVLGVIGRNGAGKTTLLRLLAGTLNRTEGIIDCHGRVAAILELGVGFHPEYTGRENIVVGGLCLGMARKEIAQKMDSIIAFSQLENAIDRPFKSYSSGMKARLAFATATSVDPDILIIDEALSVGDALFAERCHKRIRKIVEEGATVILVTHSLETMYELCTSAILLHEGWMVTHGSPRETGYAYEQLLGEERSQARNGYRCKTTIGGPLSPKTSPGTHVEDIYVVDAKGRRVDHLENNTCYAVRVRCVSTIAHADISLSFRLQKPNGTVLYGSSTSLQGLRLDIQENEAVEVDFWWDCHLASGQYLLGGGVAKTFDGGDYAVLHILRDACVINVGNRNRFQGDVDFRSTVRLHRRNAAEDVRNIHA